MEEKDYKQIKKVRKVSMIFELGISVFITFTFGYSSFSLARGIQVFMKFPDFALVIVWPVLLIGFLFLWILYLDKTITLFVRSKFLKKIGKSVCSKCKGRGYHRVREGETSYYDFCSKCEGTGEVDWVRKIVDGIE